VGSAVTEVDDKGHVLWKGKVVRSDPPRRLAYTFEVERTEDPDTTVAFEIGLPVSPLADGAEVVRLELTQTGFTQGSALREDCARAWAEILSSIKTFVETGRPLGFAWKH
jgi:hypothetical protein